MVAVVAVEEETELAKAGAGGIATATAAATSLVTVGASSDPSRENEVDRRLEVAESLWEEDRWTTGALRSRPSSGCLEDASLGPLDVFRPLPSGLLEADRLLGATEFPRPRPGMCRWEEDRFGGTTESLFEDRPALLPPLLVSSVVLLAELLRLTTSVLLLDTFLRSPPVDVL